MEKKQGNSRLIAAVCGLAVLILVLVLVYRSNRPAPQEGSKAYTLTVKDNEGAEKSYSGRTDAEFLADLMDELEAEGDFSYEGTESDYGLYIEAVNGLKADYEADAAYWAIYVNDEYGMYGADSQPVTDGDSYALVYESAAATADEGSTGN